jgi:hypothetical protein
LLGQYIYKHISTPLQTILTMKISFRANTDTSGYCLMEELPVWCDIISYDAALLSALIKEIDQPFSV